ncbi:MAG: Holliday junction branch migration protein RuvA [Liquorilactobacillus nagelii]|uniref:Holliday junction branch migration protein RuvA n=1 Tax=Liquorilactobacillus nagelii TaxID=82688 RepID=UPI00242AF7DD|nr:Holliday junction branch migration protein RuvA [Liquorilactobacillus nagelii]MCI1633202.1 Holliday junction branch migration protein RuvA [Liquorilactobacillus nagelii]MCI1921086.1 Holliday junction branch migration protein RuvA [Liquorilactobacillus nagelii]MCI1975722.1 Holliday junction branch migration protein RuvA [Liquorilactobacillus nagelii]
MYEYLTGMIAAVTPSYIVVDVDGVGYLVYAANPFRFSNGQQAKVFVYQAVRDNDISLYGFTTQTEKNLFVKLLNVSGIGPKSALAILATNDLQGLVKAIQNNSITYLTKFPGVGKKTAQQIVLDLKDKLAQVGTDNLLVTETISNNTNLTENGLLEEALAALSALGYTRNEIKKIKPQLEKATANTTDEYLRLGLKLLMKN